VGREVWFEGSSIDPYLFCAISDSKPTAHKLKTAPGRQAFATFCWYNARMTLMEITYELQSPLLPDQLRGLGRFANTYGLRRFRLHEDTNRLTFEYDASRLKEIEVEHILREARIPVSRRVEPVATVSQIQE
jgi:hypothetical protein